MWQGREVSYFSRGRCMRHKSQTRATFAQDKLLSHMSPTHTIFCHTLTFKEKVMQGSTQRYGLALMGISTFLPSTISVFYFPPVNFLFPLFHSNASTVSQNQIFGAGVTKNIFICIF